MGIAVGLVPENVIEIIQFAGRFQERGVDIVIAVSRINAQIAGLLEQRLIHFNQTIVVRVGRVERHIADVAFAGLRQHAAGQIRLVDGKRTDALRIGIDAIHRPGQPALDQNWRRPIAPIGVGTARRAGPPPADEIQILQRQETRPAKDNIVQSGDGVGVGDPTPIDGRGGAGHLAVVGEIVAPVKGDLGGIPAKVPGMSEGYILVELVVRENDVDHARIKPVGVHENGIDKHRLADFVQIRAGVHAEGDIAAGLARRGEDDGGKGRFGIGDKIGALTQGSDRGEPTRIGRQGGQGAVVCRAEPRGHHIGETGDGPHDGAGEVKSFSHGIPIHAVAQMGR